MSAALVAHVDAFCGVGASRLLGAAIDAGADPQAIRELLAGLELDGWLLTVEDTERGGVPAVRAEVSAGDTGVVRTWGNIRELLSSAGLPAPVRRAALGAFRRLAEVESRLHRVDEERVHLHELGSLEAIVAVTAACCALHLLGVERVTCGPVGQGVGMTRGPHGMVPVPAPQVLELLRGAHSYSTGEPSQLCTPTGAALLAELVEEWRDMPVLRVLAQGYGAGSRQLNRPNVLHLVVGEPADNAAPPQRLQLSALIEAPPERLAPLLQDLRDAGADATWAVAVRLGPRAAGTELTCVVDPRLAESLRRLLVTGAATVHVRSRTVDAWPVERSRASVQIAGGVVRLRVDVLDGRVVAVVPDPDDCRAVAASSGLSPAEVAARAEVAWSPRSDAAPPAPSAGA